MTWSIGILGMYRRKEKTLQHVLFNQNLSRTLRVREHT